MTEIKLCKDCVWYKREKFEVVDTYKGRCDVVRWTNNQLAEYKYFLVCKDK